MILSDIVAERAVLSGICQHGQSVYFDVADIIKESTFTINYNKQIFSCLKHLFERNADCVDLASIFTAGKEIGFDNLLSSIDCQHHIESLFNFTVNIKNIRKFAIKIKKLELTRNIRNQLKLIDEDLIKVTGDETITGIFALAENKIFDLALTLGGDDDKPKRISDDLVGYIEYLAANPVDQLGISTGWNNYDKAIGGGLRNGTVNVISARPKVGKTLIGGNIGFYIASELRIPVLNLDTEMTIEDHKNRTLAMASECYLYDIETGKFAQKPHTSKKVKDVAIKIQKEKVPYFHKSIAGVSFDEQLSIARRWLIKEVGLNTDGTAKQCVIIYDYLKLMTADNLNSALQEYQMLGFMMTGMHNFAVKYKLPILMLLQQNRDGLTKETTDTASGSDRVIWLCSNFSILKLKSDEEIAQDGPQYGNRKLVPVVTRHGAGIDSGDYINCFMRGSIAKIVEGKLKSELIKEKNDSNGADTE